MAVVPVRRDRPSPDPAVEAVSSCSSPSIVNTTFYWMSLKPSGPADIGH
jgi:hypothetical protein